MNLTDWELEDYLQDHKPKLYGKYLDGKANLKEIRKKLKIGFRKW